MEIETEVKTYRVDKRCEKCEDGLMISTGMGISNTFSTDYEHKCNQCGHVAGYSTSYPYKRYEDVK